MNLPANLDALSPDELRTLAAQLMAEVGEKNRELHLGGDNYVGRSLTFVLAGGEESEAA